MLKRFRLEITVLIALVALTGALFVMPTYTVEAGGCDFYATGTVASGGSTNITVTNVGNNKVVVEVAGGEGAKYRVRIGGSNSSGTFGEDDGSRRISRSYANDVGNVKVSITSRGGGAITYAVATTNCDDIDGDGADGSGGGASSNEDGRISNYGTFGAAYFDDTGIYVYRIGADSVGYLAASATASQLAGLEDCPAENIAVAVSEDGRFGIYRLSTCEYQINIGPDDEGKVETLVFSSLEASEEDVRRSEFFLP